MSLFGNPMLAGHSGVQRFVGLNRAGRINRHITRSRGVEVSGLPEQFRNPVKEMLGTSTMVKTKRKTQRKLKRRRGVIRKRVPRALAPRSKLVRVKCTEYVNQAHGAGALSILPIQLNSCDDPFTTGSTQQPLGYDQWKALYNKAIIVGSKVILKVHNNTSTALVYGITPMPVSQGTTGLTIYEYYMELPQTKSRILSPDVDHAVTVHKVSTKKHLQVNKLKDADELTFNLATETPPTKIAYWHLWSQPMDQSTATTGTACQFVVTVEYMVLLIDPVVPARSVET